MDGRGFPVIHHAASERTAAMAVAGGSILFGTTGLFVHFLGDMPSAAVLAYRMGFGALAVALLGLVSVQWRGRMMPQSGAWLQYVGLGASVAPLGFLYYYSILTVGMGLATILVATTPIFVALANWAFWDARPDAATATGLAMGFGGIVLVAGGNLGGASAPGVIAGLGAGAFYAAWVLFSRTAGLKGASAESQAAASVIVGSAIVIPVAFAWSPALPHGVGEWAAAAALGAVVGVGGLVLFMGGLKALDATRAGLITYLEPLTAAVLGAMVLREAYSARELAGSALILGGMVLVSIYRQRVRAREARLAILDPVT